MKRSSPNSSSSRLDHLGRGIALGLISALAITGCSSDAKDSAPSAPPETVSLAGPLPDLPEAPAFITIPEATRQALNRETKIQMSLYAQMITELAKEKGIAPVHQPEGSTSYVITKTVANDGGSSTRYFTNVNYYGSGDTFNPATDYVSSVEFARDDIAEGEIPSDTIITFGIESAAFYDDIYSFVAMPEGDWRVFSNTDGIQERSAYTEPLSNNNYNTLPLDEKILQARLEQAQSIFEAFQT
jgi:hypothetical protein